MLLIYKNNFSAKKVGKTNSNILKAYVLIHTLLCLIKKTKNVLQQSSLYILYIYSCIFFHYNLFYFLVLHKDEWKPYRENLPMK